MSTFDAFKQYQSEQARIRQKIRDEENPFHAAHIQEFSDMTGVSGDESAGTVLHDSDIWQKGSNGTIPMTSMKTGG